jgi:phosphatidylinositol dimannoside acyltransferase
MFGTARDRALDLGYAAGWNLVKGMPRRVSAGVFRAAADAAAVRNGPGTRQLRKNLRRVVGPELPEVEMDDLVGAALRSYARYWLETFRLPAMDAQVVADITADNMTGDEHIIAGLERGKGVILALPHTGNWDVAGIWLVSRHGPFTTVAERLKPDSLFDRFVAYRESLGFEILALTGGQRSPMEVLAERLRQNRVVCLLADRDLSRNGVEVQFFGEPTRMPAGPALLAATTGATLLAVHCVYPGEQSWGQSVSPPVELPGERLRQQVTAGMQTLADVFAARIAEHPADWHMLQRLWLADLPPRPDPKQSAVTTLASG